MQTNNRRKKYSLRISVTPFCNLNCKYCSNNRKPPTRPMMDDNEILEIISSAVKSGINKICWTGGEPTIRKSLIDLIEKAKKMGIEHQRLTTNGVIYYKIADKLKIAGLNQVDISIDTLDKDKYKDMCGLDALDDVMKSVSKASKLYTDTKISAVVTKDNFSKLTDLIDFVEEYKGRLTLRMNEVIPCGELYDNDSTYFDKIFVPIHKVLLMFSTLGKLTLQKNRWDMVKSIYFKIEGFRGTYGVLPNPSVNFVCDKLGCTKIRVSPTGYVSNCTIKPEFIRDFREISFKEKCHLMEEIILEKEHRTYKNFRHRQRYYDFWRFGIEDKIRSEYQNFPQNNS